MEGVAGVRFRAAADGRQSTEIAVSASSTGSVARVLADSVDARGTTTGAVSIAIALGTTLCVGTADVSGGALAHGTVVPGDLAVGPLSALVTSTHALEAGTMLLVATLGVVLALVATSLNGVALRIRKAVDQKRRGIELIVHLMRSSAGIGSCGMTRCLA